MKEFKLLKALDYFRFAWANVSTATLRNGWKSLFEHTVWTGGGEFFMAESAEPDLFAEETFDGGNWYSVDEDDPGFGLASEDDIEREFFGDINIVEASDGDEEIDEVVEVLHGGNGDGNIVIEERGEVSPTITDADALNAGITFLKWFEDLKDVDSKEKTDLQRIVEIAKKKLTRSQYFSTMAYTIATKSPYPSYIIFI